MSIARPRTLSFLDLTDPERPRQGPPPPLTRKSFEGSDVDRSTTTPSANKGHATGFPVFGGTDARPGNRIARRV